MAHTPQPQIRPTEYMVARTTILVVDDESGPRESLKMILSPAHKVFTATDGRSALQIMREHPIDLVTIDLRMPGMDGEQLMETVREEYPSTEIVVITGNGSIQSAVAGLRHGICDYISKPFDVVAVTSAVRRALERRQKRTHLVDFLEGVGSVLGKDRDSGELLERLGKDARLRGRLRGTFGIPSEEPSRAADGATSATSSAAQASPDETLEFLDVLAQALESRDGELRKHAQRVGFYADLLAEQLGVCEELRETIRLSSFLHDIGKVGLGDDERLRAQLRTRPDSRREEEHPEIGARLVEPLGFDAAVADGIRSHHECWDGSGYPSGAEGDAIPLPARVIAVVDRYDKLTRGGEGLPERSSEEALAELQEQSGKQLDPAVVVAFVRMVENGHVDLSIETEGATQGAAR